jgi:hypothetical protein
MRRLARILTEAFDRLAPGGLLLAIELAKVKNLPLEDIVIALAAGDERSLT